MQVFYQNYGIEILYRALSFCLKVPSAVTVKGKYAVGLVQDAQLMDMQRSSTATSLALQRSESNFTHCPNVFAFQRSDKNNQHTSQRYPASFLQIPRRYDQVVQTVSYMSSCIKKCKTLRMKFPQHRILLSRIHTFVLYFKIFAFITCKVDFLSFTVR